MRDVAACMQFRVLHCQRARVVHMHARLPGVAFSSCHLPCLAERATGFNRHAQAAPSSYHLITYIDYTITTAILTIVSTRRALYTQCRYALCSQARGPGPLISTSPGHDQRAPSLHPTALTALPHTRPLCHTPRSTELERAHPTPLAAARRDAHLLRRAKKRLVRV